MGEKQAQARKLRQAWLLLLPCLAVVWAGAASGCGSAEPSLPAEGVDESRYLSPTPLDAGLLDGETVLEEALLHNGETGRMGRLDYSEQARRMALLGKWEEAVSEYSLAIAVDPSDGAAYEGRGKGPLYAR